MIHFPRSKFERVIEMPLATNHGVTGAGQALMAGIQQGVGVVKLHDGSAAPVVGFSVLKPSALETSLGFAQTFVPTSDNLTAVLAYAPTGGNAGVKAWDVTSDTAVTVGATAAAGQLGLVAQAVTFDASMVGHSISMIYSFAPTLAQLRMLQGDQEPGGVVSLAIGSCGVMKQGTLYTSAFDATEAWFNFNETTSWLSVDAGGLVSVGTTTANKIPNGTLMQSPSGDFPFVGFSFAC